MVSHWVDLVFYNYLLRCFVLIDLKVGNLTHQDIGQMESYVRMFDAHARPEAKLAPKTHLEALMAIRWALR